MLGACARAAAAGAAGAATAAWECSLLGSSLAPCLHAEVAPRATALVQCTTPPPASHSDHQTAFKTTNPCLSAVLPNGITTGLDIGFSNKSLVFITMSFYTMCKSTTPVWLLLFAFIWGLER